MMLLSSLRPRFELAKNIIHDEFEEVNEIFFVEKGTICIGYNL